MNKDLFDSMQKQMNPSPEVRAALSEKLARPAKRRLPVRKYMAVAACAALAIGGFSVYRLYQNPEKRMLLAKNFHRDVLIQRPHSYVLTDGLETGVILNGRDDAVELYAEESTEDVYYSDAPEQNTDAPSATETAPASGGGARDDRFYVSQDEAIKLYDILCGHLRSRYGRQENFSPNWPDWYGGGYLNNDRPDHISRLTLVLVKDYDTPELRREICDFLGSSHVDFQSGKYALSYLLDLQKKIMDYPVIREVFASSWTDEESNCLNLTLTEVTGEILMTLAELDPDDDAIYVQAGKRIALDEAVDGMGEDPIYSIMPGGAVISEGDEDLIADEPWVDDLPEKLPAWQQADAVRSVPEEDAGDPRDAVTYEVETGEITVRPYSYRGSESPEGDKSGGAASFNPGA